MALKDDRVEQCLTLRSCGSEFQTQGPKQEKVRKPRILKLMQYLMLDVSRTNYACLEVHRPLKQSWLIVFHFQQRSADFRRSTFVDQRS